MELNPYIAIPVVAWLLAQWIKFSIQAFKGELNFRYLYASGGMPSVHSAVVSSLFVTTWGIQGSMSPLFGITAILAGIVIYDSLGVRRSTGEQAIVLNALVDGLEEQKIAFNNNVTKVREVLGHQPSEVAGGVALGTLVAIIGNLERLNKQVDFLTAVPKGTELYAYIGLLLIVLVGVIGVLLAYGKRWGKEGQTGKLVAWLSVATILGGLFICLAASQAVAVLGSRWPIYVLLALLAYMIYYIVKTVRALPPAQEAIVDDRKSRWLAKERKKKRKK